MRNPIEIIADLKAVSSVTDLQQRVRTLRALLAEAGDLIPGVENAWSKLGWSDESFQAAAHSGSIFSLDRTWPHHSANEIISVMNALQREYEDGELGFAVWRDDVSFLKAHVFLQYLYDLSTSGARARWRKQLPHLQTWTLTNSRDETIELVSDAHPGTDEQLGDLIFHVTPAAIDALEEIDSKIANSVARRRLRSEPRLLAELDWVNQCLDSCTDESTRVELEEHKRLLDAWLSEIRDEWEEQEFEREIEVHRQRAIRDFKADLQEKPLAALHSLRAHARAGRKELAEIRLHGASDADWNEFILMSIDLLHLAHATIDAPLPLPNLKGDSLDILNGIETWAHSMLNPPLAARDGRRGEAPRRTRRRTQKSKDEELAEKLSRSPRTVRGYRKIARARGIAQPSIRDLKKIKAEKCQRQRASQKTSQRR
ncbi:MAG TPA: hypothetical protein ENJ16_03255 [Planctomycetaceae bacterium]|nr:hypothetical protein [Planctomycetaceae bacterium]